jgi:hypothetical protein|tara:strand:+ start:403 stop:579 length:177 start_codon:yes stop_codon:yes gene_type:complete
MPPKKKPAPKKPAPKKTTVVKPQNSKTNSYKKPLQYNVQETIKPNKIVKKDIFEMMTK